MLLRNRTSGIDSAPITASPGYEHLPAGAISVLRWLKDSGVDYVLVGILARAIRGEETPVGPVAIVPAPYGRNLERLSRGLIAAQACTRSHAELSGSAAADAATLRLASDQLVSPQRWVLRCGEHDLDIEGRPFGVPSYQELLFESIRFDVAPEVSVEVAALEDIELYDHIARTGRAPEISVSRAAPTEAA